MAERSVWLHLADLQDWVQGPVYLCNQDRGSKAVSASNCINLESV